MKAIGVALVHAYRFALAPVLSVVDPVVDRRCKYHPTCSQYALDAFRRYGLLRGLALAGWRLARCNPWSHGGVDRVESQRLFRKTA